MLKTQRESIGGAPEFPIPMRGNETLWAAVERAVNEVSDPHEG